VVSDQARSWVLPSDPTAAFHARRHVEASCSGLPEDCVDIACLLATELVSNAVRHGRGTVVLAIARDGSEVRVDVSDESPELPVVTEGDVMREHGAGLRLVDALASSWGTQVLHEPRPGKRVWFALAGAGGAEQARARGEVG